MSESYAGVWIFIHLREPAFLHGRETIPEGHFAEFPTSETLEEMIWEYAMHEVPAFAVLQSPDSGLLRMALGPVYSGLSWLYKPGFSNERMLLGDCAYTSTSIDFSWEGHGTTIQACNLVPTDQVVEIGLHFFKSCHVPEWTKWSKVELFNQPDRKLPDFVLDMGTPVNLNKSAKPPRDAESTG